MLDKEPLIKIDYTQEQANKLEVNGQHYSIATRGFLFKHQCLLDKNSSVWLTIKKRGEKNFRLVFSNGNKYQLEVLTYSNLTYVFYDKEDTEIFRIGIPSSIPDAICLLISEVCVAKEEFATLVAWGFYCFRHYSEKKHCKPAA
jgi:hypothetical protein